MPITDTIVIGAGQAGLAASRCLSDRGVDHVVLERGRIAERWRSERWDSLRLLTPNWMSRLPGSHYDGPDPHGFMTAAEVTSYFDGYAHASAAPVHEEHDVLAVEATPDGYRVVTTGGEWRAAHVVIATGWCDEPAVPALARDVDTSVVQVTPSEYRRPSSLPDGGVLVVGASATGVQLADELAESGRDVVLAVGSHSRLPRSYRGMDIFWWLERIGSLDRTLDEHADARAALREPSVQLVGRPDHRNLDLDTLQARGVSLTGRLTAFDGSRARFAADLARTVDLAEVRLRRVLAQIDDHIDATGLTAEVFDPDAPPAVAVTAEPDLIDLATRGITSILWATGYRRSYPWLRVPVLDDRGEIVHRRGVTQKRGLYVLGQRYQHTRKSTFIDGVGPDAAYVVDHIVRSVAPATTTSHRESR